MLFGIVAAIVLVGGSANADFTFGELLNLGQPPNTSFMDEYRPCISADGLTLFFVSDYPDDGDWDLFVVTRDTLDDNWADHMNLGSTVNMGGYTDEWDPCISTDGLELYFSRSAWTQGIDGDLYVTTRETTGDDWGTPVSLGPVINSTAEEYGPTISGDGLSLYFSSDRAGGYGEADIWVTTRRTIDEPWGTPVNLGPTVNSSSDDFAPSITSDGMILIFSSVRPSMQSIYPLWAMRGDFWMTKRRTTSDTWAVPINLEPIINTNDVRDARISPDGSTLFLGCFKRPGGYGGGDIWQAQIIPIVDFNGDGKVDTDDLLILIDNWGINEPLCDIGPTPFGDGIVDMKDLEVFMSYWEKENIPEIPEEEL